ncbi:hypothetical protein B0T24DRAFT_241827 [Lasiosphaeria ovina]|uniref:Uncharacterized protein n=1 Tax=Lasiosphaeria ovina TaxID=92902 RepID=A0AAE0N763_9PEZI|nr:hypothetical protein B0T24DRAFT_241827 [Lasiosphaeria ovina]
MADDGGALNGENERPRNGKKGKTGAPATTATAHHWANDTNSDNDNDNDNGNDNDNDNGLEPGAETDGMPTTFPKKRRGRPPGRPNMTVREADYNSNPLVQAWNAAKSERTMAVVPVMVRNALTESSLVHDTQRAVFRLPSRESIYFVQNWITARHIASQRPSYVNGLLIHSRGSDAPISCSQCAERRNKHALGPFLTCRTLPGYYHSSCSNCKWFDNTSVCSLYTGPKPNRKRKAKESAAASGNDAAADATISIDVQDRDDEPPSPRQQEHGTYDPNMNHDIQNNQDDHDDVGVHSDAHFVLHHEEF